MDPEAGRASLAKPESGAYPGPLGLRVPSDKLASKAHQAHQVQVGLQDQWETRDLVVPKAQEASLEQWEYRGPMGLQGPEGGQDRLEYRAKAARAGNRAHKEALGPQDHQVLKVSMDWLGVMVVTDRRGRQGP